jgi:hypothetical protein
MPGDSLNIAFTFMTPLEGFVLEVVFTIALAINQLQS